MLISLTTYAQEKLIALTIDSELKDNANAVVRLRETQIEFSSYNKMITKGKRVVTVLNASGRRNVGAHLSYDNEINIKKLGAIIYDALGNEIKKFKKNDFTDESAISSFSLYEDSRVKYLDYTPVSYPYTVEFYYETITNNTAYIPQWMPLQNYYVSTEKSIFKLIYDESVGINKKMNNLGNHDIEEINTPGQLLYIGSNIKAIKPEAYSPRFKDLVPYLQVTLNKFSYEGYTSETNDWKTMGKWMYDELLADRTQLSIKTQDEIKRLINGIQDPIEKAKIVYNYVQENTRYISIQEGIGGIQPILASKVDEVKYGDCKGLTNYTKALLDVVGVESYYTRVYASENNTVDVDKDFVSFVGQTNHVILNIPNEKEDLWLECTSQTSPFNYSANFTDDRDVFVITPEGGKIVHTKEYKTEDNLQSTKAKVSVDVSGNIFSEIKIDSEGTQYGNHNMIENASEKDKKLYYKNYLSDINNLEIVSLSHSNDKEKIVFSETIKIKGNKYASKAGIRLLFAPNMFNKTTNVPPRYTSRKLPFKIERGFTDIDEYEITLPETLEVEALMKPVSIDNQFGSYSASIEKNSENKLVYKRKLILNKGDYKKEDYKAFRDFYLKIVKHDKSKIALKTIQ